MRWSTLLVACGLLVAGIVEPGQAQEEREECVCVTPEARVQVWPRGDWTEVLFGGRARLGVYVNTRANPETDRYGALINGVTENGPADKAGIEEGDIITRLGGQSLLSGDEQYDEDESAPGMRLIERARELEAGDTVEVEFRRDGETRTVELVAGDFAVAFGEVWRQFTPDSGLLRSFGRLSEMPHVTVRGPESFAFRLGATLPGLELTSLNPDLGEYFGTEEGVLVVSIPEDSELGLKSGDVILRIDGRDVRSPSHAMRILRSYEPDEEVSFSIMRRQREATVTGRVVQRQRSDPRIIRERERRYDDSLLY